MLKIRSKSCLSFQHCHAVFYSSLCFFSEDVDFDLPIISETRDKFPNDLT